MKNNIKEINQKHLQQIRFIMPMYMVHYTGLQQSKNLATEIGKRLLKKKE